MKFLTALAEFLGKFFAEAFPAVHDRYKKGREVKQAGGGRQDVADEIQRQVMDTDPGDHDDAA